MNSQYLFVPLRHIIFDRKQIPTHKLRCADDIPMYIIQLWIAFYLFCCLGNLRRSCSNFWAKVLRLAAKMNIYSSIVMFFYWAALFSHFKYSNDEEFFGKFDVVSALTAKVTHRWESNVTVEIHFRNESIRDTIFLFKL